MDGTTTPTATATSTPSAPSVSPSTTENQGPMSARDALALAESSPATPETPAAPTPTAAVTPSGETPAVDASSTPVDDPRSPTIPRARFDEVNTRMSKAEAELKSLEWAKDLATLPEGDRHNLLTWHRTLNGDPATAIEQVLSAFAADPQYAPLLRSHAARVLGSARATSEAPADDPEPEADLQTPDGALVYSAPQQKKRDDWLARRITAELTTQFERRLGPVQEVISAHQESKAHADVASVLTELRGDPDFKAHEADIKATLQHDAKLWALADRDPRLALELAYARVYRTKVLPTRDEKTKADVLANLQQRAVAGTTNPGAATTSTPPNTLGNAREALRYAESVVGAA